MEIGKIVPQGLVKTTLLQNGGQIPLLPLSQHSLHPFSPISSRRASSPLPTTLCIPAYHQHSLLLPQSWLLSPPSSWVASFCPPPLSHSPSAHPLSSSRQPLSASSTTDTGGLQFHTSICSFCGETQTLKMNPSALEPKILLKLKLN